ncbi:aminoglycoside phosphotransferase family protein [Bacillus sp. 123MFChir2]|uniref:aminoglycoside phosphotransferase family protein n=1 Tax=Bacillus sp. 123MFChir2 TaxID=1169144 RepID=UPI00035E815C|nr:aminoglycoside phosphotransferase family protein [Bacillus sp. 123MFChir2]
MTDSQYRLEFKDLCQISQLGELLNAPESISGGLLHRMYIVDTTKGKYAIKLLNPQIMLRPTAIRNYINSEKVANFLFNSIPNLPAKIINGDVLQKVDSQFYLVFDWIEGESLKPYEINNIHCEKIGAILAKIHQTDFSELSITNDECNKGQSINWNYYLQKGNENSSEWVKLLLENLDDLNEWNSMTICASESLSSNMVISHRDLDSKNVMWNQYNPVLIDWESAGYINPMRDLIETAIYWSENGKGDIDKQKFFSFISGYKKSYGELQADWRIVLANGFLGKLGWLEYSLKRSLWIECTDEEEQQLGTIQVTETIHEIRHYADTILKLLSWLNHEL